MKRSDFLIKLAQVVKEMENIEEDVLYFTLNKTTVGPKTHYLLDKLEELGMTPPLNKYVFHRWDEE